MDNIDTKTRILRESEKLFALHGIDAVSLRTISTQIGQRNKTAAQYHFGSKEGLIKAIFFDRMTAINLNRQQLLDLLSDQEKSDLYHLVEVLFIPFVRLLLDDNGGRFYVRFTAQLFSLGQVSSLMSDLNLEFDTQTQLFKLIKKQLKHLPKSILEQRLNHMALLLTQAAASKDFDLDHIDPKFHKRHIQKFSDELVNFVVGGLLAPVEKSRRKIL